VRSPSAEIAFFRWRSHCGEVIRWRTSNDVSATSSALVHAWETPHVVHPSAAEFARIRRTMDDARHAWRRALVVDDENVQALDTACWIIRDYLNSGVVTLAEEVETLADWADIIERYGQVDMTPDELVKYDDRDRQLAQKLGDTSRFEAVLQRATARGVTQFTC